MRRLCIGYVAATTSSRRYGPRRRFVFDESKIDFVLGVTLRAIVRRKDTSKVTRSLIAVIVKP